MCGLSIVKGVDDSDFTMGESLLLAQSVDDAEKQQLVVFVEPLHACQSLLYQLRVRRGFIEKFTRTHAEIVAYCQKFLHRWQCLAGGDIVDISSAMSQIIAHLIF